MDGMRGPSEIDQSRIRRVLRRTFGISRLRQGQEEVISRVLRGRSTLALMPTGAGKSLCYQVPALLMQERTLVISPLIALMKDQCDTLRERGIAVAELHSGLSVEQDRAERQAIRDGSARIVFTTPEQLLDAEFVAALESRPVALLVVDEAHCLSQWGFDFRPAFLEIGRAAEALGRPTVLALTATATDSVIEDILSFLSIPRAGLIGTDPYRPNLHYAVQHFSRAQDRDGRLIELVAQSPGSGIVYVATVKAAVAVHAALQAAKESVGLYHGKLATKARHAAQDAFMNDEVRVMVATNAFGLGIDKPDIRFVVHHQMPSGLDAYYQESGRAGRDGAEARCTLLCIESDRAVQQFFLAGRYPGLEDFRKLASRLAPPRQDGSSARTLEDLFEESGPRRKVQAALGILRKHALVETDAEGRLDMPRQPSEAELATLAEECRQKSVRDRAMLERMVSYTQSGRCRWELLLEHLQGGTRRQPCGQCDNCLRIVDHIEHTARAPEREPAEVPSRSDPPLFDIGSFVRTRRHGAGEVVAADAAGITVRLTGGEERCFQPHFLVAARQRHAAGA